MLIRTLISFVVACLVLGFVLPAQAQTIPGVSDEETTIPFAGGDGIRETHLGAGDSMFVRDRANRWYRIGLNEGCLADRSVRADTVAFRTGAGGRLDRLSRVTFVQSQRPCAIESIRRSVAPPMVDSKSPIPAD